MKGMREAIDEYLRKGSVSDRKKILVALATGYEKSPDEDEVIMLLYALKI